MSLKIIIEGADGSGKETQSNLLKEYFKDKSIKISFPNYTNTSSIGIKHYLETGLYDLKNKKSLMDFYKYIALIYAVNRYETFNVLYKNYNKTLLELINDESKDFIFIFDRYTTSNMLHLGSNFENNKEREEFVQWLLDLEYNIYKIPKPDIVFYLYVPTDVSLTNIINRKTKINSSENDIHESITHLTKVNSIKDELIEKYKWVKINCVDEKNNMLTKEEIHQKIINKINELTNKNLL